ncbi:hypothetical protein KR018_005080 [Drosophila ironensis]|nr:hypothetical protein KR018_005080 [Drosophila ironensis]
MLRQVQLRAHMQLQLFKRSMGFTSQRLAPFSLVGAKKPIDSGDRASTGNRRFASASSQDNLKSGQDQKGEKDGNESANNQRSRRSQYNPLSRRHSVSQSRVEYIYEKHRELAHEVELRKPKGKQFVTRHSLHSGRQEKIN